MYYIGLDLGQRVDHSALVVVQRTDLRRAFRPDQFEALRVRHAERAPLGTSYPEIVNGIRQLVNHPDLIGQCALNVDATGVGAPVVDMLRNARLGCEINAITITGGQHAHQHSNPAGLTWSVPKQDLISGLLVLLERQELLISTNLRELAALIRELTAMRITTKSNGNLSLGAAGSREHDDLVMALALACWNFKRPRSLHGTRRLCI